MLHQTTILDLLNSKPQHPNVNANAPFKVVFFHDGARVESEKTQQLGVLGSQKPGAVKTLSGVTLWGVLQLTSWSDGHKEKR